VRALDTRLKHSRYYDEELLHPLIDETKRALEQRGYRVEVVAVPSGEVDVRDLTQKAQAQGCDLFAVETVSLVRSWNIGGQREGREPGQLSSSFGWQFYVGGLVLTNMSIFDIASGQLVWQHSRRQIAAAVLGPLLGEAYDESAGRQYSAHPAQYQVWMYRQSATRAIYLMFHSLEEGFHPLPYGSNRADSLARSRTYARGEPVFVRPVESGLAWLPATVVSDARAEVEVRWADGVWPAVARQTRFARQDVAPRLGHWPPIVWVRARDSYTHTPFRFVREGPGNLATVRLGGTDATETYLLGRLAVAADVIGPDD